MLFAKRQSKLTDLELIAKYQQSGRARWMGELFNRHAHLVFGVCLKYLKNEPEAKDATLGIFEKLLSDLKSQQIEKFEHWLYRVAKNHCLMILRKQQTAQKHQVHLNGNENPEEELSDKLLLDARLEHLHEAIGQLNDEQKQCLTLFYLEQKSYQEVADLTGSSIKSVKSSIQNGKRNLKIKLSQHNEFKV
jgi:RNA polymerase sigma factor (sigma-70 family)